MVDRNTGNMFSVAFRKFRDKKKGKQVVYFDHQRVNSLFPCHHYCVTIELKKHDYKPINAVIFFELFCKSLYNCNKLNWALHLTKRGQSNRVR